MRALPEVWGRLCESFTVAHAPGVAGEGGEMGGGWREVGRGGPPALDPGEVNAPHLAALVEQFHGRWLVHEADTRAGYTQVRRALRMTIARGVKTNPSNKFL